jgi:ATPase family AAA domain-containing protein 2
MEMITLANVGLAAECEAVYQRELERERKAKEKREKELAAGKEVTNDVAKVPPQQSVVTTETSGPITLGEPVPGRSAMPPVTPLRPSAPTGPLTNGTSANEVGHVSQQNGSTVPSRTDEDAHMTDSQDLNANTQHNFQTPSRIGTQTQKSQASVRTFIAPNSNPHEYHNSASTTTNTTGHKTSDRSSGAKLTQSTNGATPAGMPNLSDMIPQASGSQLPDTQGLSSSYYQHHHRRRFSANLSPILEVQYINNSQPSTSQPSQSSSHHNTMPAPAPPRPTTNLNSILNDDTTAPKLIIDERQISDFHNLIVSQTSGCSLEQLEQITAALMDAIWKQRAEWNRNVVLHEVKDAFNEIIADIQAMQAMLKQDQNEEEMEGLQQHTQPPISQVPAYAFPDSQPPGTQFATQYTGSSRQRQSGLRGPFEASQYS